MRAATLVRASIVALLVSQPVAPGLTGTSFAQASPGTAAGARTVLDSYCVSCHNQRLKTAGLQLDGVDVAQPAANAELWERVIARLRAGSMPPQGRPRPDAASYRAVAGWLESEIDRAWATAPNPGRAIAVH